MPPKEFQSSFIPKEVTKKPIRRAGGTNFINLIAVVLLVFSILSAAGVFLYKIYLSRSLESKQDALAQADEAFDRDLIEELQNLDRRLDSGEDLLDSHVAASLLLERLEEVTSQAVRFTSFGYSLGEEGIMITMEGEAESFGAIAYQSDIIGARREFRDVIFSGLATNESGNVGFSLTATIDPQAFLYAQTLPQ